jgi:menaquinone-dependent protoporphyrinogen oxidase
MHFALCFATREGQTRRIAEFIAQHLRRRRVTVDLFELGKGAPIALDGYDAVVIASPVHAGCHPNEAIAFVRQHRDALGRVSTAFVSVSLSEAAAEREGAPASQRDRFAADVASTNERFFAETGWRPTHLHNVAGALAYRRYGPILRWVMKRAARRSGGAVDTSRDHEYTDWLALDAFAATL